MGYHPETLVCRFPPYPRGGTSLQRHPKPLTFGRVFYALSPWIGFDVWHIDPETPGTGNRQDDSCGWFDRTPREYSDAVAYVLKDQTTMHEIELIIARKVETVAPFYEGISDRIISYPRLPAADSLAMCLMVARELENRRWWNGQNGKDGATSSRLKRAFTRRRNVDGIAFDLALNPIDNLSSIDSAKQAVHLIAAALGRRFRPWWKHPRLHVHHWQIKFNLPRNLRRMVQACAGCGKRLGFGYCPTSVGGKLYHGGCYGSEALKSPEA